METLDNDYCYLMKIAMSITYLCFGTYIVAIWAFIPDCIIGDSDCTS